MESFMKCINRIARCGNLYRAEHLEEMGLNGVQPMYVLCACNHPGISQEQMSQEILVNKSNVCRQLANLEQIGFIYREPDEKDRRILRVYPTEKAKEAYSAIREVMGSWRSYLTEDFTEQERAILNILLEKMYLRAAEYADSRLSAGRKEEQK